MGDERLKAYERMQASVVDEHDGIMAELSSLKEEGKVKTATYQQLFARKMTLSAMLDIYKRHGLL